MPHYSFGDCSIGGFKIPKRQTSLVNTWVIHKDPNVWEEPIKFKPESQKFEGCEEGFKFLPFGKGRRACPGTALSRRLINRSLGTMLQSFDWERLGPRLFGFGRKIWF